MENNDKEEAEKRMNDGRREDRNWEIDDNGTEIRKEWDK